MKFKLNPTTLSQGRIHPTSDLIQTVREFCNTEHKSALIAAISKKLEKAEEKKAAEKLTFQASYSKRFSATTNSTNLSSRKRHMEKNSARFQRADHAVDAFRNALNCIDK